MSFPWKGVVMTEVTLVAFVLAVCRADHHVSEPGSVPQQAVCGVHVPHLEGASITGSVASLIGQGGGQGGGDGVPARG